MRIISGKFKGKRLNAPDNLPVRPTTDYAKESLFNIINNNFYFDDLEILDCFSGTGNIGYEFISRGVGNVTSIDGNSNCIQFQKQTIQDLKIENFQPIQQDVFKALTKIKKQFDLIFCDPPYDLPNIADLPNLVFDNNLLVDDGWLIVEHSKSTTFSHPNHFETRKYGTVNFSIFKQKNA